MYVNLKKKNRFVKSGVVGLKIEIEFFIFQHWFISQIRSYWCLQNVLTKYEPTEI